jgi:hypothetical protein
LDRLPIDPTKQRLGLVLALFALLQITGGHWAIMQTSAWVGMLVNYSRTESFEVAAAKTFDGKHPCAVCTAVEQGKKHEEKQTPLIQSWLKKDLLFDSVSFRVDRTYSTFDYPELEVLLTQRPIEPVEPPPKLS